MRHLYSGKVRDVYEEGPHLILVASDRVSVYDIVLPDQIPHKGEVLTRLSNWWLRQLEDLVPHHLISATRVPANVMGRAVRVRKLDMIPVECIVRGAIASPAAWWEYEEHRTLGGRPAAPGLLPGSILPIPMFTPTTKAPPGEHDRPLSPGQFLDLVGHSVGTILECLSLAIFQRAAGIAQKAGLLLADTKLEFGFDTDGRIVLADEVLTPDSSRFWDAQQWRIGRLAAPYDKQVVRDFVDGIGWNRTPPAPRLTPGLMSSTSSRYIEVFERLTGCDFETPERKVA